ncbi:MAG: biopolymer transporter ExbD [Gammaproteobacteria bacterium]
MLLHADGSLELEGQTLLMGQLPTRLEAYLGSDPQPGVIVLPDTDVALQTLVSVFDLLQATGVRQLTLGEL